MVKVATDWQLKASFNITCDQQNLRQDFVQKTNGILRNWKYFDNHQFPGGFIPVTSPALLDCTNDWYVNMDRGVCNLYFFLDV